MLTYGLPCMMTGLPQMLNLRLDQIAMAALLSSRELGLYVVAVAWSGGAAPLLNSIGAVLLPAVAASADRQQAAIADLAQIERFPQACFKARSMMHRL